MDDFFDDWEKETMDKLKEELLIFAQAVDEVIKDMPTEE